MAEDINRQFTEKEKGVVKKHKQVFNFIINQINKNNNYTERMRRRDETQAWEIQEKSTLMY